MATHIKGESLPYTRDFIFKRDIPKVISGEFNSPRASMHGGCFLLLLRFYCAQAFTLRLLNAL